MNFLFKVGCFFCLLIGWGLTKTVWHNKSTAGTEIQKLDVRQEANRVVMTWSGPVMPPMKQQFEDAFRALGPNSRRVLISFNSPGGSVDHGQDVIRVIQAASKLHYISTTVEANKLCASMCVPLYLSGAERFASPSARFMFHEVILKLKPDGERALRQMGGYGAGVMRAAVSYHTDRLFEDTFESKLDNKWLERMRTRISRGDVWLTAKELMNEKSGVVDKLI